LSKRTIILSPAWRPLVDGTRTADVEGDTVGSMLQSLATTFPVLRDRIFVEGEVHPAVLVFVGDTEAGYLQGLSTPLPPHVEVRIMTAISGG